jgi:hypothetical protein
MSSTTTKRIAIMLSLALGLLSSLSALLSDADVFFITERFFLVLIISAALTWTTLTIINSVIIGAAKKSLAKLNESLASQGLENTGGEPSGGPDTETTLKGLNLDMTSAPLEDLGNFGADPLHETQEKPEIKEFEPFKPRRLETDKGDSSN